MVLRNIDIRQLIAENNVKYWELCAVLGRSGSDLSQIMRIELNRDIKRILRIAIAVVVAWHKLYDEELDLGKLVEWSGIDIPTSI